MSDDEAPPIIVPPDGTIDLQWVDDSWRVAGPDRDPKTEHIPAGTTVIGFRFRPAVAAAWLRAPASEIVGQRMSLEDLWGSRAGRLACDVHTRQNIAAVIHVLENALSVLTRPSPPVGTAMCAAYRFIERGIPPGAPLIPWLRRALGMSERTLRRRFNESFGYGPKTLDRILRYQRFLRLSAKLSESPTAILAAEAGYSDQAHLIRESVRLSGNTPLQLIRAMNPLEEDPRSSAPY